MAFSATTQWDVRTTGSDNNGGGFDTAATGTNRAIADSPFITFTDLVIDGTTNTKCTSAAHPFDSTSPGNIINITGGTGFTVQRVQIVSVTGSTATCDKSLGTLSSTGGTGNLGGGLQTVGTANGLTVSGNTLNIKSGTYTQTSALAVPTACVTITWLGYGTTWADGGTKPLITTATNSVQLVTTSSAGTGLQTFSNISFSHTAGTRGNGLTQLSQHAGNNQGWLVTNCIWDGFSECISSANATWWEVGFVAIIASEIKNSTGTAVACWSGGTILWVIGSYIHNNSGYGIQVNPTGVIDHCIVASNGSYGIYGSGSASLFITNSTIYANGNFGVSTGNTGGVTTIYNTILYGQTATGAITYASRDNGPQLSRNNAFGGNFSANVGWPGSTGDVALSANPFTNAGAGNFSLNSTAGGGAACKGAGYPGAFAGGTSTGTLDIGAVQSAGSSAVAHPLTNPGMAGGISG